MSKTVIVKKDEDSGEYYFDISEISDLFEDFSLIDSYSIEQLDDGSIIVEFYDVDGNKVIPSKV